MRSILARKIHVQWPSPFRRSKAVKLLGTVASICQFQPPPASILPANGDIYAGLFHSAIIDVGKYVCL